ncbi:MAG TPA: RNase adapter RapZ [Streptosporangiaceae bacterium]|jgi:UPF0042 nucleotide-binding protein
MSADSAIQQGIVIITGLSGAGRSTAAKSLEDLDWFVADNLPVDLLPTMADLARRAGDAVPRLAAVVDIRSRAFSTDLKSAISELHARGIRPFVVFLEASDETLVRRFDSVSRPHPLQDTGRVIDGIAAERELLQGMRAEADLVLDTSKLNVHELRARMRDAFASDGDVGLRVTVVSFGYKYGLPVDADMVADCRFLPNPHWIPELAPQTGEDQAVIDYVLNQPGATDFVAAFVRAAGIALNGFGERGRHDVLIAVGCTGGKHRSVVMANRMAEMLARSWPGIRVTHRDLGRE